MSLEPLGAVGCRYRARGTTCGGAEPRGRRQRGGAGWPPTLEPPVGLLKASSPTCLPYLESLGPGDEVRKVKVLDVVASDHVGVHGANEG